MSIARTVVESILSRKACKGLNYWLYKATLKGMGLRVNTKDFVLSGEKPVVQKLIARCSTTPVVFDVGANRGKYSRMVRECSKDALVYAFEPHPINYGVLKDSGAGDARFHPYQVACGETLAQVELFDNKELDGSPCASLYRDVVQDLQKGQVVTHLTQQITLDGFIKEHGIERIDLLKIDTEGHELSVLKGASNALREGRIDAIQFEFNEMNVYSRTFMRDFMDILPNYSLYRILPSRLQSLHPYSPMSCEIFAIQNILAIRNGSKFQAP